MPAFDFIPGHRYLKGLHGAVCHKALFSSPKAPAQIAAPVIPDPVVVPTENTAQVTAAQQNQLQASAVRTGRASTILSSNDISKSDTMGD